MLRMKKKIYITTDDLKYALLSFDKVDVEQFNYLVGETERDYESALDMFWDNSEQVIRDFIEQLMVDSIEDTINTNI